jgi:6,7-dimethyl-8-ribityllumazine synthase
MSTQLDSAIVAPKLEGPSAHILIVRAPYNVEIVDGLRDGAVALLTAAGATYDVLDVAGALELAATIRFAVRGFRHFDGYVALGCVIKGDTDHYEHVCREAMSGMTSVALQFGLCLGNGLLTVATEAQAIERSGADGHNKGAEAAAACVRQIGAARWLGAV